MIKFRRKRADEDVVLGGRNKGVSFDKVMELAKLLNLTTLKEVNEYYDRYRQGNETIFDTFLRKVMQRKAEDEIPSIPLGGELAELAGEIGITNLRQLARFMNKHGKGFKSASAALWNFIDSQDKLKEVASTTEAVALNTFKASKLRQLNLDSLKDELSDAPENSVITGISLRSNSSSDNKETPRTLRAIKRESGWNLDAKDIDVDELANIIKGRVKGYSISTANESFNDTSALSLEAQLFLEDNEHLYEQVKAFEDFWNCNGRLNSKELMAYLSKNFDYCSPRGSIEQTDDYGRTYYGDAADGEYSLDDIIDCYYSVSDEGNLTLNGVACYSGTVELSSWDEPRTDMMYSSEIDYDVYASGSFEVSIPKNPSDTDGYYFYDIDLDRD